MVRLAFAGDKAISVSILRFILESGVRPLALLSPEPGPYGGQLRDLCPYLEPRHVIRGRPDAGTVDILGSLHLDYLLAVHYPHIFPAELLSAAAGGILNLHPAYLPFNRGWHTPSWAILEKTPIGATLHFMNEQVDAGDIVHQKEVPVEPDDTADRLYQRILETEMSIFQEAWPWIRRGEVPRFPQKGPGSSHRKSDLGAIQPLREQEIAVIDKLRALTTNDIREAAFFESGGRKYYVQVSFHREQDGTGKT